MRQRIALWSTLVIALTATTFAIASTNAPKTISGCVDKKSGVLRISNKCLKSETLVIWNQQGMQGEIGPQGPSGFNGIDGKMGEQGAQGPVGPAGKDGVNGKDGLLGPQGPSGPAGPQGATPANSRVLVIDGNGNSLGFLMSEGSDSSMETSTVISLTHWTNQISVFLPTLNRVIDIDLMGNPRLNSFLFTTSNCTGTPYQVLPANSPGLSDLRLAEKLTPSGAISWFKPIMSTDVMDSYNGMRDWGSFTYQDGTCHGPVTSADEVGMVGVAFEPALAPYPPIVGPLTFRVG